MKTHDPENERIKRRYLSYLREAKGRSEPSLDALAAAFHRFEAHTKFRPFKQFNVQQAIAFKRHMIEQANARTGEPLSKASLLSTTNALREFFLWLAGQPGYRSRLSYGDADYFRILAKDVRIAKARRPTRVPTIEQIRHVLDTMPTETEIEKRNRALVAFTLLTGARDSAIASLKLKHVNLDERYVYQDAREVRTKFSKSFTTWFFPVGDDVRQIVDDWITFLRSETLWGLDDPLFPNTLVGLSPKGEFQASGLSREHWKSAGPIRAIFKEAFKLAGLPYANPHSFRNTLVQLGERLCKTPEEFKAWSQNLGHEHVMTTFMSYGAVASARQLEIIRSLSGSRRDDSRALEIGRRVLETIEMSEGGS